MEQENYFDKVKRRRALLPETDADVTGTVLSPGKPDICKGNGKSRDDDGNLIEMCCDHCDYYISCFAEDLEKQYGYLFGIGTIDDYDDN